MLAYALIQMGGPRGLLLELRLALNILLLEHCPVAVTPQSSGSIYIIDLQQFEVQC